MTQDTRQLVDLIIDADWVLPMISDAQPWIEHGSVVIDHTRIVAVCTQQEARQLYRAKEQQSLAGHALLPGFINGHGHAAMSLLRGFADDLALHTWLNEHIWPAETKHVSEDFVRTGTQLALAEMLLAGVTCFSDMYFFPNLTAQVAADVGIRAQICPPILEFPTNWASNAAEYMDKALQVHADFSHHDLIKIGFGPHAPYTVSDASLEKVIQLANDHDTFIQMHIHETASEVAQAVTEHGERPLSRLKKIGLLSSRLQAVHMTQLLPEEITWLAESNTSVIHCPQSNLKLASGFCPLHELLAANIAVAIGTDGAASNNNLDVLEEIRTASLLAKAVSGHAESVNAFQALQLGTHNAATALGLAHKIGSLQPGLQADCIVIDLRSVNTQPVFNPLSAIAYAAQSSQISHVWVNGRLLVKNRELQTLDLKDILDKTQLWRKKLHST
jgi:5-methylthioadenosine/S-adenosylhomocysteine deaminase